MKKLIDENVRTKIKNENLAGGRSTFCTISLKPLVLRRKSIVVDLSFIMLLLPFGAYCHAEAPTPTIETQVLRIFATRNSGYYHKPWKSPDFTTVKASAFFFKDEKSFPDKEGLILTNAHAVSMAQSIKVSNGREKRRYEVKLVAVFDSADFAVLQMEPEDLKIYESRNGKIVPLEFGDSDLLRVGDKVLGWGYPLGGERISKSEQGEISRIEVSRYAYSQDAWLMIQASLQQNRGNSGGPVIKDEKVVGISFQGMTQGDRINYFIPINLVKNLIPLSERSEKNPSVAHVHQSTCSRASMITINSGPSKAACSSPISYPAADLTISGCDPRTYCWRSTATDRQFRGDLLPDLGTKDPFCRDPKPQTRGRPVVR